MQTQENMIQRQCRGIIHIVQKGDTLYLLSKKYHVSVTKIMYANPYVDIYHLTAKARGKSLKPWERGKERGNRGAGSFFCSTSSF